MTDATTDRAANAAREALGMAKSPPVSTDADEDEQEPGCPYCRGTGLSPYSIRDVSCPYCGGQG